MDRLLPGQPRVFAAEEAKMYVVANNYGNSEMVAGYHFQDGLLNGGHPVTAATVLEIRRKVRRVHWWEHIKGIQVKWPAMSPPVAFVEGAVSESKSDPLREKLVNLTEDSKPTVEVPEVKPKPKKKKGKKR